MREFREPYPKTAREAAEKRRRDRENERRRVREAEGNTHHDDFMTELGSCDADTYRTLRGF